MTITVIGHLCLDVIHHPDGTETRSYGGIFFSLATLANLLGPKDTIFPVFGVGKDDHAALLERLAAYPNVDPSGIYKFAGPTNQVSLHYKNEQERTECSRHISEPIPLKKIRPYLESDMILVNMISGFDITLETLDEIRMDDTFSPQLLTHELLHAYRSDFLLAIDPAWNYDPTLSGFEESFAHGVSYEAMNSYVTTYPTDPVVPASGLWGSSMEWDYDVQNAPELRGTD